MDRIINILSLLMTTLGTLGTWVTYFSSKDSQKPTPKWLKMTFIVLAIGGFASLIFRPLDLIEFPNDIAANVDNVSIEASAPMDDDLLSFHNATPGETIELGTYRAAGDEESEEKPIKWLVLEKKDNRLLLLSQCCIDTQPYHKESARTTWEDSYIRKWLQDYFFKNAFSDSEREKICMTNVKPDATKVWDCDDGNPTSDYIFLLSVQEVKDYIEKNVYFDDNLKLCNPTDSALTQDIYVDQDGHCWWWLRNSTRNNIAACRINSEGFIDIKSHKISTPQGGIRPAMWVSTE